MSKLLLTALILCLTVSSADAGICPSKPIPLPTQPTQPSKSQIWDAMENAITTNDMTKLNWLLKNVADPNYMFRTGSTPLIHAIDLKNFDAVQILLSYGAKVTMDSIINAYHKFDRKILSLLLPYREKVSWLFEAIWSTRNAQLVKCLIDFDAPVNARVGSFPLGARSYYPYYDNGMTALHLAARVGAYEIVEVLLANGANPAIRDSRGNLPEHLAILGGYLGIADVLKDARLKVSAH